MANINYTLLTPGDDEKEIIWRGYHREGAREAYDGGAGIDLLTINWTDLDLSSGVYFGVKKNDGTWQNNLSWESQLNDISSALAASAGEFNYYTKVDNNISATYHNESFYKNFEKVNMIGTSQNDLIVYQQGKHYDGGNGIDTFYADLSDQDVLVTFIQGKGKIFVNPYVNIPFTQGAAEAFEPTEIINVERLLLRLGNGHDRIFQDGINADNEIWGGKGNDDIITGGGQDVLYGESGNDMLFASGGDDKLDGGAGNDILLGGAGKDQMLGGLGDDVFVADANDQITEYANEGNDTVISWGGYDLRNTPNVENVLAYHPPIFRQVRASEYEPLPIWEVQAREAEFGPIIPLPPREFESGAITSFAWDKAMRTPIFEAFNLEENLSEQQWQNLVNNTVHGNDLNNELVTLEGDNRLYGYKGNDVLYANAGNDILDGGVGEDIMYGGLGNDRYYVDNAGDKVIEKANEGSDWVFSSINFDLRQAPNVEHAMLTGNAHINLTGSNGGNHLIGNGGNNTLNGLGGNDKLEGGAGNDILDGGVGADQMIGGQGNDKYYVDNAGDKVIEKANEGSDWVYSSINFDLRQAPNVEHAMLSGNAHINLTGSNGGNHLIGNGGNNTLHGLGGNDKLEGGTGNDILDGGVGADQMIGGQGNDKYYVDNAGDKVIEKANEGSDWVFSSINFDLRQAPNVEHAMLSGNAHIHLTGSNGGNHLIGNGGNNTLNGLGGNDKLEGGTGNDILIGGSGKDTLIGGAGNDVFKFTATGDSTVSLRDVINDFTHGDKIDLSAIDANSSQAGNQTFSFIGGSNFSAAGQVRFEGGVVYGDVNGDKVADFAIELKNVTALQVSDFIL